jgi:hypothetical protein
MEIKYPKYYFMTDLHSSDKRYKGVRLLVEYASVYRFLSWLPACWAHLPMLISVLESLD